MAAEIMLFSDAERTEVMPLVSLGEVLAPNDFDDLVEGQAIKVYGKNTGSTSLRQMTLSLEGEGAANVQLAQDVAGAPGVWAAAGESIVVSSDTVFSNGNFEFWARGVYNPEDTEGTKALLLMFNAISS